MNLWFYRCARYPPLPAYCTMTPDPTDKCCQKPYCIPSQQGTTPVPTPGPSGQVPTIGPKGLFSGIMIEEWSIKWMQIYFLSFSEISDKIVLYA